MRRLSIGAFAQESGLSPKALRLYDDLGLLAPADVDLRTGYRSYDRCQLATAKLIVRLRVLGMPLERIRVVLALPSEAAAAEVASYWRQVEADTAARREAAASLIDQLSRKDATMTDAVRELEVRGAASTDIGLVRDSNQDAVLAGDRLFAVADGFGAQGLGRAASSAALDALERLERQGPAEDPLGSLSDAVRNARAAVREFTKSDITAQGAGTTLTAMLWSGVRFALAHVGDSRAYLLRGAELTRLTHDHSFVQSLVDEGKLTVEEAAAHPQRAMLLRALEHEGTAEPDMHLREARAGDRYLLCSDGLTSVLDEQEISRALGSNGTSQQAADRLVELVRSAGAPDNVSCLVVDATARA